MIEPPQIVDTEARLTAVIRLTVPRAQIQEVMGPAIGEVMEAIAAQGIAAVGPWFTYHLRLDPEVFDFEVGIPVVAEVAAVGRVQPGQLPAARVAQTVYQGPYEGLGAAWGALDDWVATNAHVAAEDLWEYYEVGPESGLDPSAWRTQLNRPLIV